MRLKCTECRFYTEEGKSLRCIEDDNTWDHWAGMAYKKHPTEKNLRGNCEDYEEIIRDNVDESIAPREL